MKKFTAMTAALALMLALCACSSGAKNDLFAAAAPETSVLELYICEDGESSRRLSMYDTDTERALLDKLSGVKARPAEDWTPGDVTLPVYGINTGRNDNEPGLLEYAWSNGYLIASDGGAYKFDFDFAALETDFEWRDKEEQPGIYVPCKHALSLCDGGWIGALLNPAGELTSPEGISMELDYLDCADPGNSLIAVTFTNSGDEEWWYGTYYHLEAELDGAWYVVPAGTELAFNDIAMLLPAGESRQEIYHTGAYGELPPGTYRFVAEGMAAQFVLDPS